MSKFNVGDKVRVTKETCGYDEYKNGDILTVIGERSAEAFYAEETEIFLYDSEVELVETSKSVGMDEPLPDFDYKTSSKDETAKQVKVYLAGPMTGIEHYNFPAFNAAAVYLRSYGYEVFNPAENDVENGFDATGLQGHEAAEHGFDLRTALKQDLSWICDHADVLALLDGHENSKGVAAEKALANALGLRQFHFTRLTGGIPT